MQVAGVLVVDQCNVRIISGNDLFLSLLLSGMEPVAILPVLQRYADVLVAHTDLKLFFCTIGKGLSSLFRLFPLSSTHL